MKVFVEPKSGWEGIKRTITNKEGCDLTVDLAESDLSFRHEQLPFIVSDVIGPSPEKLIQLSTEFGLVKFSFNGELESQTAIVIPIRGLVNGNLGPATVTGCGSRFVTGNQTAEELFEDSIRNYLHELSYTGWFTIAYTQGKVELHLGVPWYGNYNLLMGLRGDITDFFIQPYTLYESWAVSMVIARWPWPEETVKAPYQIQGVTPDIESKGVWLWGKSLVRNSNFVGVVSGAGPTITEAVVQAQSLAQTIQVPDKFHRTDLSPTLQTIWGKLKSTYSRSYQRSAQ